MQATEEIAAAPQAGSESIADAASPETAAQDESGGSGERSSAALNAGMNGFLRGQMSDPTMSPDESAPAGESAPAESGDVKPAGQAQQPIPRRGVPKVVTSLEEKVATLESQLAERDPEKLREQWVREQQAEQARQQEQARLSEMERTQRDNVERYRRLVETPDSQLSTEDYTWREGFKEKLAEFPEVRDFFDTAAADRVKQAEQAHVNGLRQALTRHARLPGVDGDAFKKLGAWDALGDHLYEAGKKAVQPEIDKREARIRELEGEVRQLTVSGRGGLGAGRDAPAGGRSGSMVPADPNTRMNGWLRGGNG